MPNVALENFSEGARQMAKGRRWATGRLRKAPEDWDAAYQKVVTKVSGFYVIEGSLEVNFRQYGQMKSRAGQRQS